MGGVEGWLQGWWIQICVNRGQPFEDLLGDVAARDARLHSIPAAATALGPAVFTAIVTATLATAAGASQTTAGRRLFSLIVDSIPTASALGPTCATIPRASQSAADHTTTAALAALAPTDAHARLQCYRLGRHHNLTRWYIVDSSRPW